MSDLKTIQDIDPIETQDWISSIDSVIKTEGKERARFLLEKIIERSHRDGITVPFSGTTFLHMSSLHILATLISNIEFAHIIAGMLWL